MAIQKTKLWFSKTGKGVKQVELLNQDGTPAFESDGKTRLIGNEQYQADQLTDESVDSTSPDKCFADMVDATGNDLVEIAAAFRLGWNVLSRRESGLEDPYIRAAKGIVKLAKSAPEAFPIYKGKTVEQVAEMLKAANAS
jgi:hypothetical protein